MFAVSGTFEKIHLISSLALFILFFEQAEWKDSASSSPLPSSAPEPALPLPQSDKDTPLPKKLKSRPPPLKRPFDSVDK